jgi:MFS family permease
VLAAGAVGTFPLFVPPFFIPLYSQSLGLSSSTGAALLAAFNFSSAVGRIMCGYLCDSIGSLNTLFISLLLTAISMLSLWPASTSLSPLAIFVVVNGVANGGFFSTMPTVVGNTFGSARVAVAMGMIVTGWVGGYLMVSAQITDLCRRLSLLCMLTLKRIQGAPIAGYLLESYGGAELGLQAYRPAMFYAGSLALGSASLVLLVRLRKSRLILVRL